MNTIYKLIVSRKYRIIAAIVIIFAFHKEFLVGGFIPTILISLILLLEIVFLIANNSWWSNAKYILIWSLVIVFYFILWIAFRINVIEILGPLVWILGFMESKYSRLSITLALTTTLLIVIMSSASSISIQSLFALLGVYLGVRSIRIRQEAYQASQLHLKELNELILELRQAHEELQKASVHSMRYAALEERNRIAREIHDGIGHQLTSLIVQLQALELMIQNKHEKAAESAAQLLQIARKAMSEVRLAVKEWSNDEMGLGIVALKGLVSQTQAHSNIKFTFCQESEVSEWSLEISVVLYRILQESLTNILRHSNANLAEVHIKECDNYVTLTVIDNGKLYDEMQYKPGFGMTGMIERSKELGGICTINPVNPKGFCVEARLPIESR